MAYKVLLSAESYRKAANYLEKLKAGERAGAYLSSYLEDRTLAEMTPGALVESLMRTKSPQIFAESVVIGDGKDWTRRELAILGDVNIAVPVTVYDNGRHTRPRTHPEPFDATLLFTPGALLRNGRGETPADWDEVTRDGELNRESYYELYERRLIPLFMYANELMTRRGKIALITVPGLGCGQFAGQFMGRLGEELKQVLKRLLQSYGSRLSNIKAVYYDPYRECSNERLTISGIEFLVRPLTQGNEPKSQLCSPGDYEEEGDDYSGCELFSFVAWDHVSWPGNDFFTGSRATDDGVKAAATSSMAVMTGIEGFYDARINQYSPPPDQYRNWAEVVARNSIELVARDNVSIFS